MATFTAVFLSILAVFVLYTLVAPAALGVIPFLRQRRLSCPKHGVFTDVKLNGLTAALSTAYGSPRYRVANCRLLAPGERCDEGCLRDAS